MKRILIAGIGNVFHGDDAFGCEVVRQLKRRSLPEEVTVTDFGIRNHDLVYALADHFDAAILVDAAPRGSAPGTLYLIEPDVDVSAEFDLATVNGHTLDPVLALRVARLSGDLPEKLFLVGCEPQTLEPEDGDPGLSRKLQEALPDAVAMIESLVERLLEAKTEELEPAGFAPVHHKEL